MSVSQVATNLVTAGSGSQAIVAEPQAVTFASSLKRRAISGSAWLFVGYGASQSLRLINSIILTRLIAPHVTGLMAMVSVFLIGLEMFSDIGIGPSIIQNKRGAEPSFLNTAWTIQAGRGVVLWLVACIGARPVAAFFGEPSLAWLIPIAGLSAVIAGFNSTSLVWLNRQLSLKKVTILGILDQIVNYAVIIAWAFFSPTVWALVGGSLISTTFYMVGTHFLERGHRNRFHWNAEDAKALFHFGRWIFFSTVLTFFAMQADRIMCGRLLGTETLGVYGYAAPLALLAPQFIKQIGNHVAFPVLSEIARTRPHALGMQLWRLRVILVGGSFVALVPLMLFGHRIIHFLYDPRWWDAGWMVRILAAGALAGLINSTYGCGLLALGKSFQISCLLACHLLLLLSGALLGYWMNGEKGFIVGLAAVEWLNYPATAWIMARYRLWQPAIDLSALAASLGMIALAYWMS